MLQRQGIYNLPVAEKLKKQLFTVASKPVTKKSAEKNFSGSNILKSIIN